MASWNITELMRHTTSATATAMVALIETRQDEICTALAAIEGDDFVEDRWERPGGGGGRSRLLEDGSVIERGGVNVSVVHGELAEGPARAMSSRGRAVEPGMAFFATGISLVIHPRNPNAPTTHANFRYFEAGESWWFGGGADLTPYRLVEEDARSFHACFKAACDARDPSWHPRFKKWCDDYFWLPHRNEHRGVGGIFFDDLDSPSPERLLDFIADCADAFLEAYVPILEAHKDESYDSTLRDWQLQRRGRYVEFNLLHDRGTAFGLRSGGRTESILMSLPPKVIWRHETEPEPHTPEHELLAVLRHPRDWV